MTATDPTPAEPQTGPVQLTEYQCTRAVALTRDQRDLLRRLIPTLTIQPTQGESDRYDLTPKSTVGIVRLDDLVFEFRPKIPVDRLLFMLSYSVDPKKWHDTYIPLAPEAGLLEAVIPPFAFHTRTALRRGLLHGYRNTEEALPTVRGRVRFDDQIRFRYGLIPPVEVRYDDFTDDITENRLLKAALHRLRTIPVRSSSLRQSVRELESGFATVTPVEYTRHQVPQVTFTRLNEHYRPAVGLARLILQDSSIELRQGTSHGTAVLVDMAKVFEDFVYVALREHLRLSAREFPQGANGRPLSLARDVRLQPDISWWDGITCTAVGDIKYKSTDDAINHPDLYQLLAYLVATDLPAGLLIYAAGEAQPTNHLVTMVGRELRVRVLGIDGEPQAVLQQIQGLAQELRDLRRSGLVATAA